MKIKVNSKEIQLDKALTVRELLTQQKVEMPDYVTVQINEALLQQDAFDTTVIRDGDEVEFLYFMGGGQKWEV
ncbi:sulfur carrier protein ThiS [Acetonema longum]|uniref:Thiamine biosynthesis protein ThiS n=1 Tax=Acetonema longum DSM 6540 TaxID=1009370 RepID=F7NHD6_9FIRM|nr:sulfur carrier protein ThiS [Acetonema longum]EGO64619.1 thiamine biosynthesis protein ThiS [Acetonema longum DSM 6540]